MIRTTRTFALAVLLSFAGIHAYAVSQPNLADGIVSSVNPALRLLTIAGGQITIDASQAKILDPANNVVDFSAVAPGEHISAIISDGPHPPSVPLHAISVSVLQQPVGLVTGAVEAIDLGAKTFTVLGLTIHTTDTTSFGGDLPTHDPRSLAELRVGDVVTVEFDGSTASLTAVRVHIVTLDPPTQTLLFRATLIAKLGNVWIVVAQNPTPIELHITGGTSIEGDPQPLQQLDIVARIDAGVYTAISIRPASVIAPPPPPNPQLRFTGILKARTADSITVDNAISLVVMKVTNDTHFEGDPKPGDNVDVIALRSGNDLYALVVTKRSTPISLSVVGNVIAINGQNWTIGAFQFIVNDSTVIVGSPKVGDRVRAVGERQTNGLFIARSIEKF